MTDDEPILGQVRAAFSRCGRPEHFTNYTHCEECAEHVELLRSRDNDTLGFVDVSNPGWDPLCYVKPAGLGYFFPGLARLSLAEPDPVYGWYPQQLLFHLTYEGPDNRHLRGFAPDQRRAVAALLRHIAETRPQLADEWLCSDDLLNAINLWSVGPDNADPSAGADPNRR
jgi:hypothetical protein